MSDFNDDPADRRSRDRKSAPSPDEAVDQMLQEFTDSNRPDNRDLLLDTVEATYGRTSGWESQLVCDLKMAFPSLEVDREKVVR